MKDKKTAQMIREDEKYFIHNRIFRFIVFILLTAAFLLIGMFVFRSGYHQLKTKRLVSQARAYAEKGDIAQAALAARTAVGISPKNVEAIQFLAELAEREKSPIASSLRYRLLSLEPENTSRKTDFARSALSFGNVEDALETLEDVPEPERNNLEYQNLLSAAFLRKQDIAGAETPARKALELAPDNPQVAFNLLVLLVQKGDPTDIEEVNTLLHRLSREESLRKQVNRLLFALSRQSGEEQTALELITELASEKNPEPQDYVPFLDLLAKLHPEELDEVLAKLLERLGGGTDTVAPLLSWMLSNQHSERALAWIDGLSDERRKDAGLRIARADALAALGKWGELRTWLDAEEWIFADFIRKAYLARSLRESQEVSISSARWREALREAAAVPPFLRSLHQVVGSWKGWEKENADTLWKIYETTFDKGALRRLHRLYHEEKEARGLRRVTSILHRLEPENEAIANNHVYLGLLLEVEISQAETIASEAYEKAPSNPALASTWAFALRRRGEAAEALRVLEKLSPETLHSAPMAFTHSLVLIDNGKKEEAARRGAEVNPDGLLDVEREIFLKATASLRE